MKSDENKSALESHESTTEYKKMNTAWQKGMTRGALISGLLCLSLILIGGLFTYNYVRTEKANNLAVMEKQRDTFTELLTQRDSTINEWLTTFDQIEKDLGKLKSKQNILTLGSADGEFSKDRKKQVLEDIKYLNTLLDENKKKIASLSAQLKKSGGSVKTLQNKILALENAIKGYETDMADLKNKLVKKDFEIGQLNAKVTDLDKTIIVQDKIITNQTQLMNRAYLASGTYKDLKGKGIISKEGGFLGMWRKQSLSKDLSESSFQKIDISETKTIPINSRDAKLITYHPKNSYSIVHENDKKVAYIEIKDPANFWKISRYAVVEIIR
jgi:hypothetical protein